MNYIKLMRFKHYIKNVLVLVPLFFSRDFMNVDLLIKAIIGFLIFSLTSSVVYIINDFNDIDKDRVHPIKMNRPLASGAISKRAAIYLLIGLIVIVLSFELYFNRSSLTFGLLITYLVSNIAYSLGLKKVPILDVSIVVLGFLLRIFYGGAILEISISNWLILTILAISYYLALGKRRNELRKNGDVSREVLRYYNAEFLDKMMIVMLSLFIVFYSMWTISTSVLDSSLIWSIPLVILIVLQYSLIIENDSYGDPADVIFNDKYLMLSILIYSVFVAYVLYK